MSVNEDERMARLPRWARDKLNRMEADLAGLRNDMDTIVGKHDGARVFLDYRLGDSLSGHSPMPDHTQVTFRLGDDKMRSADITVKMIEDSYGNRQLEVHGGDGLNIMPVASNVALVTLRDRVHG